MTEKGWKLRERTVAAKIYGALGRVALSGLAPGKKGDVRFLPDFDSFLVEVKGGKQIPKFVLDVLRDLRKSTKEGELPLIVLRPKHSHDELVVIRLDDFERIRELEYLRALVDLRRYSLPGSVLATIDELIELRQDGERPG